MHLSRDAQKERLRKLEKNPLLHWRISKRDWRHWELYDQFIAAAERTLMKTSTGLAPWKIVEGYDERYRSVAVATLLRDAIRVRLEEAKGPVRRGTVSYRHLDGFTGQVMTGAHA